MRARDVKGTRASKIIEQQGRVLPKTVFAKYNLADRDPYLDAAEGVEELAEKDDTTYVGEYQLVKTHKVSLELKLA